MMMQGGLETNDTYLEECADIRFGSGHSYSTDRQHHPFRLASPTDDGQEHYSELSSKVSDLSLPVPHHINDFTYHYEHSNPYPHTLHQHHLRSDMEHTYNTSAMYYSMDMNTLRSPETLPASGRARRLSQSSYQDEGDQDDSATWEPEITRPRTVNRKAKNTRTSSSGSVGSNDDAMDSKRKRFLERNRLAASKCRQKKKLWMQELEARSSEIFQRNRELQTINNQLRNEIVELKNSLKVYSTQCTCNTREFVPETK